MTANISHDRIARVRASLKSLEAKLADDHARTISEAEQLIYDLTPPPAQIALAPATAGQGVEAMKAAAKAFFNMRTAATISIPQYTPYDAFEGGWKAALAQQPLSVPSPLPTPSVLHEWNLKTGRCTECGCHYAGFERKDPCPGAAPTVGGEQG